MARPDLARECGAGSEAIADERHVVRERAQPFRRVAAHRSDCLHVVAAHRVAAGPATRLRAAGGQPEPRAGSAAELATAAAPQRAAVGAPRAAGLHPPIATADR